MNYNELTDFEINKLVAFKIKSIKKGRTDRYYKDFCPDYCNNPSDAWPIILENKINIGTIDGSVWWASLDYNEYGDQNYCEDKNPLRAAMIVYMMGDK